MSSSDEGVINVSIAVLNAMDAFFLDQIYGGFCERMAGESVELTISRMRDTKFSGVKFASFDRNRDFDEVGYKSIIQILTIDKKLTKEFIERVAIETLKIKPEYNVDRLNYNLY